MKRIRLMRKKMFLKPVIGFIFIFVLLSQSCEKDEEIQQQRTREQVTAAENARAKANFDARTYLSTLQFDGTDNLDGGETTFPMSFRFNTSQDANNDGKKDAEDNLENSIRFKIGSNLYGTGRTGLTNRGPNNQKSAVYFHVASQGVYTVYQYWYYFPDNDWANDHEHDWEKVFVYVQGTTPKYVKISSHDNFTSYSWSSITKSGTHPVLGVDGGSHAFKMGSEDGVKITWDGKITKNSGRLDAGNGQTYAWTIYSTDSGVSYVTSYTQSPSTFYYGDPYYLLQKELGMVDMPRGKGRNGVALQHLNPI